MASGLCAALTGRTHGCTDQPANVKKTLANSEPSTHGTKRTCSSRWLMSAYGGQADIARLSALVCWWPEADIDRRSGGTKARSVVVSWRTHTVLAATNKCLAQGNKSPDGGKPTKKRTNRSGPQLRAPLWSVLLGAIPASKPKQRRQNA